MPAAGRVCGEERGPEGWEAPVRSRGLCMRHYQQVVRSSSKAAADKAAAKAIIR